MPARAHCLPRRHAELVAAEVRAQRGFLFAVGTDPLPRLGCSALKYLQLKIGQVAVTSHPADALDLALMVQPGSGG